MSELYIGLMSGTSMDAVDAALVDFTDHFPKLLATHSKAIEPTLKKELLQLCQPGGDEINRMGQLDIQVADLFAQTVEELLKKTSLDREQIIALGSHGQTIRHQPNFKFPFTLQIGDANRIAELTGITTVADFRRRDMAVGGQGAPLAPAFHNAFFRDQQEDRIILNLGGIANITFLPRDSNSKVIGFDTGPANTLMDAWIFKNLNKNYDAEGAWAASGLVNDNLLQQLLADPYFHLPFPKSTGREYFNLNWLEKFPIQKISPAELQATLCELTARSIAQAVCSLLPAGKIIACGSGIKNHYLIERIKFNCKNFSVHSTEEYGISPQWIEAATWAWLARETLAGRPNNLPSVTGARKSVVMGSVFRR